MYSSIKSFVRANRTHSDYFNSYIGVRQRENLSPMLFNLYLNDLHSQWVNQLYPTRMLRADCQCDTVNEHT